MKESVDITLKNSHELYKNEPKEYDRVYILLHGYMLDGEFMFNKFASQLPKRSLIIAPNGPFLVPLKKKDGHVARFSWYFFNSEKKSFYIKYDSGAEYIKQIVNKYNADKKPVTLIGYSQGGYLAPRVAQDIAEVDTVIGMACIFRSHLFKLRDDVNYFQVHGDMDLVVEMKESLSEWAKLVDKGVKGKFIELQEVGHRISPEFFSALQDITPN